MSSGSPLPSSIGDDTGFVTSPSSTEALTSASFSSNLDAFEPGNRAHARRGTVDMCAPRLADRARSTCSIGIFEAQGAIPNFSKEAVIVELGEFSLKSILPSKFASDIRVR